MDAAAMPAQSLKDRLFRRDRELRQSLAELLEDFETAQDRGLNTRAHFEKIGDIQLELKNIRVLLAPDMTEG